MLFSSRIFLYLFNVFLKLLELITFLILKELSIINAIFLDIFIFLFLERIGFINIMNINNITKHLIENNMVLIILF